jgi:hypothetical protein
MCTEGGCCLAQPGCIAKLLCTKMFIAVQFDDQVDDTSDDLVKVGIRDTMVMSDVQVRTASKISQGARQLNFNCDCRGGFFLLAL